jgi:hypothetical protein
MRESCPFYFSTACCPELISGCASFGFKALTIGAPASNMGCNGVHLLLRVSKKSTVYIELTKGGLLCPTRSDVGASTPFPALAPRCTHAGSARAAHPTTTCGDRCASYAYHVHASGDILPPLSDAPATATDGYGRWSHGNMCNVISIFAIFR